MTTMTEKTKAKSKSRSKSKDKPLKGKYRISVSRARRGRPKSDVPSGKIKRYLDLLNEGKNPAEVAEICGVSKQAVHYAIDRWVEDTGAGAN